MSLVSYYQNKHNNTGYNSEKQFFDNLLELNKKCTNDNKKQGSSYLNPTLTSCLNPTSNSSKKIAQTPYNELFKEDNFSFNLDLNEAAAEEQKDSKIQSSNIFNGKDLDTMINLFIKIEDPIRLDFSILIHKNNNINLLKKNICDKLKSEDKTKRMKGITESCFIIMKKYTIVKENCSINDAGINDSETLYVLYKGANDGEKSPGANTKRLKMKNKKKSLSRDDSVYNNCIAKEFAPIEKIPVLYKPGYKTGIFSIGANSFAIQIL